MGQEGCAVGEWKPGRELGRLMAVIRIESHRLSFSLWTWATFQTLSLMKEEMARCHRERNPGFHSKFSQGINSQRSCYHLFEHVCVREYLVF